MKSELRLRSIEIPRTNSRLFSPPADGPETVFRMLPSPRSRPRVQAAGIAENYRRMGRAADRQRLSSPISTMRPGFGAPLVPSAKRRSDAAIRAARRRGLPIAHRDEMRAVRIGIAVAVNHRQIAVLEQVPESEQPAVKAEVVGVTVFNPSLSPLSSSTTRIRFGCAWGLAAKARLVRCRKNGKPAPSRRTLRRELQKFVEFTLFPLLYES